MHPTRRPGRPGLLDTLDRTHVIDGTPGTTDRALRRPSPRAEADSRPDSRPDSQHRPDPAEPAEPELELLVDVGDDVPPVAVGPADSDLMIQLTRLAKLHRGGLLSDGEFTAAKARLLGG